MITQPVFDIFLAVERRPSKPAREKADHVPLSQARFALFLAKALNRLKVSHPLYNILLTVAHTKHTGDGPTTIAGVAATLGLDYTSVTNHTNARTERDLQGGHKAKGNPHLFHIDRSVIPAKIDLSHEGEQLLADIHKLINRYASQP